MPRRDTLVPAETDLLCEKCGYTLNGLPLDGNCPECGKPIAESVGEHRHLSEFEQRPTWRRFVRTTTFLLASPTRFYRTLETRTQTTSAERFATLHKLLAAMLFGIVAVGHYGWMYESVLPFSGPRLLLLQIAAAVVAALVIWFTLVTISRLATFLSVIESRYWGMRLPHVTVARGLAFHSANYLPVGLLGIIFVWSYRCLLHEGLLSHQFDVYYLYGLCGFVVLSAGYLFQTYWIAMRNMMYANR